MLQAIKDNWGVIATGLLGVSELLSLIPGLKSNGIIQSIVNMLKDAVSKSTTSK